MSQILVPSALLGPAPEWVFRLDNAVSPGTQTFFCGVICLPTQHPTHLGQSQGLSNMQHLGAT
ncbi:Ribosomal RNA small subunit methyltransferase F, partial [Dissostichus eleginoides]